MFLKKERIKDTFREYLQERQRKTDSNKTTEDAAWTVGCNWEMRVLILFLLKASWRKDGNIVAILGFSMEKEMATHSSFLGWRIPGTEEPGGLPSMGLHRTGHDWSVLAAAADSGSL